MSRLCMVKPLAETVNVPIVARAAGVMNDLRLPSGSTASSPQPLCKIGEISCVEGGSFSTTHIRRIFVSDYYVRCKNRSPYVFVFVRPLEANTPPVSKSLLHLYITRLSHIFLARPLYVVFRTSIGNTSQSGKSSLLAGLSSLLVASQLLVEGAGTVQFLNGRPVDADIEDAVTVFAADLDGDEDLDILAGTRNWLSWYENLGNGSFAEAIVIATSVSAL